jgi:hypothetical protein
VARVSALIPLLEFFPADAHSKEINEVFPIVLKLPDEDKRLNMLNSIIPFLPLHSLEQAARSVSEVSSTYLKDLKWQTQSLIAMRYMATQHPTDAIRVVQSTSDPISSMIEIIPYSTEAHLNDILATFEGTATSTDINKQLKIDIGFSALASRLFELGKHDAAMAILRRDIDVAALAKYRDQIVPLVDKAWLYAMLEKVERIIDRAHLAGREAMGFSALMLYAVGHGDDSDSLPALSGSRESGSVWNESVRDGPLPM